MNQPPGTQEFALLHPVVTEKRGRGRPRKAEGAMTNAQRQAAFRARRKAEGRAVTVTKSVSTVVDGYDELVLENDRLREELAQAKRELAQATRKLAEQRYAFRAPVGKKWSYRQITVLAEEYIRRHVERAVEVGSSDNTWLLERGYADGVAFFWDALTCGWQVDGDGERIHSLTRGEVTSNEK